MAILLNLVKSTPKLNNGRVGTDCKTNRSRVTSGQNERGQHVTLDNGQIPCSERWSDVHPKHTGSGSESCKDANQKRVLNRGGESNRSSGGD